VAHGIGFIDPPGLKIRNFKKRQRGMSCVKRRQIDLSLTYRVRKTIKSSPAASALPLTERRRRWFNSPDVDGSADLIGSVSDEKWGQEKSRVTTGQ
jgi:hypothetical protein